MILGGLQFPPIAVTSFPFGDAWAYAAHAVIEGKARRQKVAVEARAFTLGLFLHAEFIRPQATYDQLKAWGDAGEVLVLQANSGLVYGQFVIDKLALRPTFMLADETIVAATLDVSLVEPGLETLLEVPAAPPGVDGNAEDTTTEPPPEDIPPDADPFDAMFDPARF